MKTGRSAALWTPPLLAMLLTGCNDLERDRDRERRGPVQTETRELAPFDAIDLQGAVRLQVTAGSSQSVVIEAREAALGRIRTEVRANTLYVTTGRRAFLTSTRRSRARITITVPQLQALKVEGGNIVRLSGVDGGQLQIRAEGAAQILAQGRVDELDVHLAGAGQVDLSKLIADRARVTVDGVGTVSVHPKETLDAAMNGVGAIFYSGAPRVVNTRMKGLGTIARREEGSDDPEERAEEADQTEII